ncbi:MAG: proS [Chlamydiales bacterium]|jgi:prolyl-tRNA synthetase|nr:proS [Chlamydiales bacterium]
MTAKEKNVSAISPKRDEDYPEWYQQVIKAADMAENSAVRGCMVIKPWGYAIWERIQSYLDKEIKATGHQNAYFPLFVPLSFLEKEAAHVDGFAKECAVVTHHRLELKDGRLVPAGPLEEPLIVRPTSETVIGSSFAKWVESYRDLPLLINQWANVVRWEMRPRLFLRTAEFLWQEGHTVHASEEEARQESLTMLQVYRQLMEEVLALPVILGEKSAAERFPGAENTYTLEMMMQDRKALQAGTSHYLGQNFSKAFDIKFSDRDGTIKYGYTTSWGVTTRLIGGLIMVHGDDDGLRLPPKIAPQQVVIIPMGNAADEASVQAYAEEIKKALSKCLFNGEPVRVLVDNRPYRSGDKHWEWIKKGVPLRIEVGPRDLASQSVVLKRRDVSHKEKEFLSFADLPRAIASRLEEMQEGAFQRAKSFRDQHVQPISSMEELKEFFTSKGGEDKMVGGFARCKWSQESGSELPLDELKLSIRCLPFEQSGTGGKCLFTGKPASTDVIIARSY